MENKIFKPKRRKLLDFLFFMNTSLLILLIFRSVSVLGLVVAGLFLNILIISLWIFVITPFVTVRIVNNTLEGRTADFSKIAIPFRKIHHLHTNMPLKESEENFLRIFVPRKGLKFAFSVNF